MAQCPQCNSEVMAGARWCGICRGSTTDPGLGRLASPGKRLGAFVLDVALPFLGMFLMVIAFAGDGGTGIGALLGILLFFGYVIWAFRLFIHGSTPGKKLLGMRVINEGGHNAGFGIMLVREWIGRPIAGMLGGLGYIWILIDQDRQGWHDKLVSTYVVQEP